MNNRKPYGMYASSVSNGFEIGDMCNTELSCDVNVDVKELQCNQKTTRTVAAVKNMSFKTKGAGISYQALSILTGKPLVKFTKPDGTPSVSLSIETGDVFPGGLVFVGQAIGAKGEEEGDFHMRVVGARLTALTVIEKQNEFVMVDFAGTAQILELVSHDDLQELSMAKALEAEQPVYWYDASQAFLEEGDDVHVLINQVDGGSSITAGNSNVWAPTLAQTPIFGRDSHGNYVEFDGIDDVLYGPSPPAFIVPQPFTAFIVASVRNQPHAQHLFFSFSLAFAVYADQYSGKFHMTGGSLIVSSLRNEEEEMVHVGVYDGGRSFHNANNNPQGPLAVGDVGVNPIQRFSIGGNRSGGGGLPPSYTAMQFRELRIYNTRLPDLRIEEIVEELMDKWNITNNEWWY